MLTIIDIINKLFSSIFAFLKVKDDHLKAKDDREMHGLNKKKTELEIKKNERIEAEAESAAEAAKSPSLIKIPTDAERLKYDDKLRESVWVAGNIVRHRTTDSMNYNLPDFNNAKASNRRPSIVRIIIFLLIWWAIVERAVDYIFNHVLAG